MTFNQSTFKYKDLFRISAKVFGSINLQFDNQSYAADFGQNGYSSAYSNSIQILDYNHVDLKNFVSPVSDPSCTRVFITSGFGNRSLNGKISFHKGIDLAKSGGCKILAAYSGKATSSKYAETQSRSNIRA